MRILNLCLVVLWLASVGCGTTTGGSVETGAESDPSIQTVDGLSPAQIDMPGVLFIRSDHGIGSYDEFLIPEASVSYRRRSRTLSPDMEDSFKALLEQSLIDAAEDARIPIVRQPGNCVMQVAMGLLNVQIEKPSSEILGRMTLVMEFRDTMSGEPLLRYARENRIENRADGPPRSEQLQRAFDEMVEGMDISAPLRAAGLADDATRPGCRGTLAERGRDASRSASAR